MGFIKTLFAIALPIILQNFLSSLVNMLDTIMVGQLGSTEIAAVGLGNQVFFVMNIMLFGTVSGGSIFIAQFWGKKDFSGIHRTMGITISLSSFISLVFFIGGFFFPRFCMSLYTKDEAVIRLGVNYLKTVAPCYLFIGFGYAFAHAERSTEHVKLPMTATIISVLINVVFNYIFIFGMGKIPAMGVVGAAVATDISRFIELLILLIVPYIKKYEILASPSHYFKKQPGFIPKYIKICLPVLLNESLWGTGISVQNSIFAHSGTMVIAAYNITGTIANLLWPFFIGCGNATAIILGKKIGEAKCIEAKSLAKKIALFMVCTGACMGFVLSLLTKTLPYFFRVEESVIHMATVFLLLKSLFYAFDAFNMCAVVGICRSGGDTIYSLIMDTAFLWLIANPLGFCAVNFWNFPYWGVFLCILSEGVCKAFMGVLRLLSGKWLRDVTI